MKVEHDFPYVVIEYFKDELVERPSDVTLKIEPDNNNDLLPFFDQRQDCFKTKQKKFLPMTTECLLGVGSMSKP